MHDWAEVHRLHEREHLSKSAIARRPGMSRPTVIRLLELPEPPRYRRESPGSKLDPHKDAIAAMRISAAANRSLSESRPIEIGEVDVPAALAMERTGS